MSVLTNKNILVVGKDNAQIKNLKDLLLVNGMTVHSLSFKGVTPAKLKELEVDLVLLNQSKKAETCGDILSALRSIETDRVIPVVVLIEGDDDKINKALSLGAADYVTPDEDPQLIVQKLKVVLGQSGSFSDSSAIDITPSAVSVTATGIRVYVVEDDPLLRNLLAIRLEKASFPTEFSSNGDNIVPVIEQFKPDVIILDLMLPGKSGFEILEEIKAESTLKDIPVIVFSNRDGQTDRKRAAELGAVGFYVKAMTDLSELIETIESLVKS